MTASARPPRAAGSLPAGVWAMGVGSMLMDVSSELVHSLLPIFMVSTLGASMLAVGVVEGVAEATASVMKVFSGALSDRLRHRKWVMVSGYALSALTKPLFPLATSVGLVLAARFADRIGKGIRGAPRDALIADITPVELRGAAYGLRQALDSIGALLGPLLAVALLAWFALDLRTAMWVSLAPALATVALLSAATRDPPRAALARGEAPRSALPVARWRALPSRYWRVVALGATFTLARFSEAFLVLRGQGVGLELAMLPVVMVVMNVAYAIASYPAGVAADRGGARALLLVGLGLLVAADVVLAVASTPALLYAGAALWGVHMGLTQGLMSKLVADRAPAELRGTAFGIQNLVNGLALLLASVIAGALWNAAGPSGTFSAGAVFAGIAMAGLAVGTRRRGAR